MKRQNIFTLFVMCIVSVASLIAMEPERQFTIGRGRTTFEEEQKRAALATLAGLPREIQSIILALTLSTDSLDEISRQIAHERLINKYFNRLLNDPKFIEILAEQIAQGPAKKFIQQIPIPPTHKELLDEDFCAKIIALATIHTPLSIAWLESFFKQFPDVIQSDVQAIGAFLLIQATATKNLAIMDSLLQAGIDPNLRTGFHGHVRSDFDALSAAVLKNFLPGVKLLLAYEADPNNKAFSTAMYENPDFKIVSEMLDAGVDMSKKDAIGQTYLILLIREKGRSVSPETVTLLLDASNVDINAQDRHHYTALDYAILNAGRNSPIYNLLRERGAKSSSELGSRFSI